MFASSVAGGLKTNFRWGLSTFNNTVTDHGFIYLNSGHGFVDPLTGIFLWVGLALVGIRLFRRRGGSRASSSRCPASSSSGSRSRSCQQGAELHAPADHAAVRRVPRHRRDPFAGRQVAGARLATQWATGTRGLVGVTIAALAAWNLAIAWDFIQEGRKNGEAIGIDRPLHRVSRDIPGQKFFLATTENGEFDYYYYLRRTAAAHRLQLFARTTGRSGRTSLPRACSRSRRSRRSRSS